MWTCMCAEGARRFFAPKRQNAKRSSSHQSQNAKRKNAAGFGRAKRKTQSCQGVKTQKRKTHSQQEGDHTCHFTFTATHTHIGGNFAQQRPSTVKFDPGTMCMTRCPCSQEVLHTPGAVMSTCTWYPPVTFICTHGQRPAGRRSAHLKSVYP